MCNVSLGVLWVCGFGCFGLRIFVVLGVLVCFVLSFWCIVMLVVCLRCFGHVWFTDFVDFTLYFGCYWFRFLLCLCLMMLLRFGFDYFGG